jgi:hypothetical protein
VITKCIIINSENNLFNLSFSFFTLAISLTPYIGIPSAENNIMYRQTLSTIVTSPIPVGKIILATYGNVIIGKTT